MSALVTPRLRLEPLVVAHADAMFDVLADPSLYRYLDYPPPGSIEALRATYAKLEGRRSPDGSQQWLNWIVLDPQGVASGFVQSTVMPGQWSWIAYLIGRSHQANGYATEATRAMLDHLRVDRGVSRVKAMVEVDNAPSVRLLDRIGFQPASEAESARHRPDPSERLFVHDWPGPGVRPE